MKTVLVIDIPDEYADRYNVNEMYVWNLVVQDKRGYQMFGLTTDKPSHLKPLPQPRILPKWQVENTNHGEEPWFSDGWNACIEEIIGETE